MDKPTRQERERQLREILAKHDGPEQLYAQYRDIAGITPFGSIPAGTPIIQSILEIEYPDQ